MKGAKAFEIKYTKTSSSEIVSILSVKYKVNPFSAYKRKSTFQRLTRILYVEQNGSFKRRKSQIRQKRNICGLFFNTMFTSHSV